MAASMVYVLAGRHTRTVTILLLLSLPILVIGVGLCVHVRLYVETGVYDSPYLSLGAGRRMADSLSGWVLASLGKGHLILVLRFLPQSVLLSSASGLCFCLVSLILTRLYSVLVTRIHRLFTFTA